MRLGCQISCSLLIPCLACSVKDRIAYNMINKAEEQGIITPGKTILVRDSYQRLISSKISVTARALACCIGRLSQPAAILVWVLHT